MIVWKASAHLSGVGAQAHPVPTVREAQAKSGGYTREYISSRPSAPTFETVPAPMSPATS